MAFTFRGGIRVNEHKDTEGTAIEVMPFPSKVAIPLVQHIGAPVKATVAKGDRVLIGQVIGRNDDALSCPVHASVSGTVTAIEARNSYNGAGKTEHIIIENDGLGEAYPITKPEKAPCDMTTEEIVALVREAGISGMGGATFPTYAKIQSAVGKAKELIVNCAECEPYITANHRLMLEDADSIIEGVRILLHAIGITKATFAIEDNKKDAIRLISQKIADDPDLRVAVMKTKYPQGDERQIMYALHGVQLPAGKLPADVGFVIFNAETSAAVFHAVAEGQPLVKRIVTVSGDCVKEPKNLLVPLGTSFADVIEFCGGFTKDPEKIISGGPMMGMAQWDINTPVIKGTSAILVLGEPEKAPVPACIHCGKCIGVCPMHLMPNYLAAFSAAGRLDMCEKYNVMSCVECGCCTYTCPGSVPIVQHIRKAKGIINDNRRKAKK